MQSDKPDSLATFVERHRADFDVHEPRPALWAAIENELAGPAAEPAAAPLPGAPAPRAAAPTARASWVHRYGVAAALALLVVAASASEAWKSAHRQPGPEPGIAAEPSAAPAGPLYGGDPVALAAAERNDLTDSRLATAVSGMESYYVAQLNERKAELRQLADSAAGSPTAEWRHDLAALDSSYHTLKLELPHHPQPDVVLTAMNRNLQIRLDLLDRQLQTRAMSQSRPATAAGLVLADSRSPRQP